jgi:hypothetical protein
MDPDGLKDIQVWETIFEGVPNPQPPLAAGYF